MGKRLAHYGRPPECNTQPQDELETTPEEEEPQTEEKQDLANQDTIVFTTNELEEEPFNTAIDDTSDDPTIVWVNQLQWLSSPMMYTSQQKR